MSLDCPDMAVEAITRLREKGLEPTLDDICKLAELARRIQEPATGTDPWLSYTGVTVGVSGRRFKPVTIKSGMWFDWVMQNIDDPTILTFATAMAMEYGHDSEYDFSKLYNIGGAISAIREYAANLDVNDEELADAIDRCTPEELAGEDRLAENAKKKSGKHSVDVEDTIAYLVAATGQPEEVWMSSTFEYALKVATHAARLRASAFGGFESDDMDVELRNNFMFMCELEEIQSRLESELNV